MVLKLYFSSRSSINFFFFNDTATTEIYPLPLHAPLPIWRSAPPRQLQTCSQYLPLRLATSRSEEHTSELQSRPHLVCRLLLEKKKIAFVKKLFNTQVALSRSACIYGRFLAERSLIAISFS